MVTRRNKSDGTAAMRGRPTARWRQRFLPVSSGSSTNPGSTLEEVFPGISWADDLEWSQRQHR